MNSGAPNFIRAAALALTATAAITPSSAQQTITYTYDARGRLTLVNHGATGPNAGRGSRYSYDHADNRTNVTAGTGVEGGGDDGGGDGGGGGGGATCSGVSFSIADASAPEGSNLGFVVTRTGSASVSCSVSYATSDLSARAGTDYDAASGTLTFSSTQTQKTINVITKVDDQELEPNETLIVDLSSATEGAAISRGEATGTITATGGGSGGDCSGITFYVATSGAVTEGQPSVFTISKSGTSSITCTVNYATVNGTATAGSDFAAKSGTVEFAASQTSLSVSVATIDDSISEGAETFTMSLSNPSDGATLGSSLFPTATINDNDSIPSLSIGGAYAVEGGSLVFTVTRTGATGGTNSVSYATGNGTAIAGLNGDYTAASGTVTFSPGQTSRTISITTLDDIFSESFNENMYVNLSTPTGGAVIGTGQGTGTIEDNETSTCNVLATTGVETSPEPSSTDGTSGSTETTTQSDSTQALPPPC